MKKSFDISSVDQAVAALGGDTAVATWLDISQPAVANWKVRGYIPPGWHMKIVAELLRRQKTFDPALFDMTAADASVFAASLFMSARL